MKKVEDNKETNTEVKPDFKADFFRFVKKWNEAFLLVVAIITWCYSDDFLRWIDPTAAVFDAGVLQKFIYAFIGSCIAHFVTWLMLKLTFPEIHSYLYEVFYFDLLGLAGKDILLKAKKGDMQSIKYLDEQKWKRIKCSLWVFCLYLLTYLLILATL